MQRLEPRGDYYRRSARRSSFLCEALPLLGLQGRGGAHNLDFIPSPARRSSYIDEIGLPLVVSCVNPQHTLARNRAQRFATTSTCWEKLRLVKGGSTEELHSETLIREFQSRRKLSQNL